MEYSICLISLEDIVIKETLRAFYALSVFYSNVSVDHEAVDIAFCNPGTSRSAMEQSY
jgi:hypothetical protein